MFIINFFISERDWTHDFPTCSSPFIQDSHLQLLSHLITHHDPYFMKLLVLLRAISRDNSHPTSQKKHHNLQQEENLTI